MAMLLYGAVLAYGALGVAVALAFVLVGVERVDPSAVGAVAFRPLLLPGAALLWPLVLACWIAFERSARGN